MRILIKILVAIMLVGAFDAPCAAIVFEHEHIDQVTEAGLVNSSETHHRLDSRDTAGSHCQQCGIIVQTSQLTAQDSGGTRFRQLASDTLSDSIRPVEQRPPISRI